MIEFTKMEGLGNDYVYVDCTNKSNQEIESISKLTSKISNRHFGVGSDGLILICKSDIADFKMTMFNQDGSQAEMCGNGIRCVGKFVYDKGLKDKNNLKIETLAGIKELDLQVEDGKVKSVTVNMGKPIFSEELVPCIADIKNKNEFANEDISHVNLQVLDKEFDFTCVSMGNPHAITFVENVDNFEVERYGKIVECDRHFPKKTNVEFVEVVDSTTVKMRVWERGAGETLACGTGATATAVACILNGLVDKDKEITVKLLGGDLRIKWETQAYMTGPANIVFEGIYSEE